MRRGAWSIGVFALAAGVIASAAAQSAVETKTLTYAVRDGKELLLDLYVPTDARGPLPVVVFLHGGGWSGGARTTGPDFKRYFARDGFAIASIEYRLAPVITFPANVEDVKTAVRFLKANARANGLDAGRICLWGTSAGGHLAAVAGLSKAGQFEGTDNLDQSSAVQCVLDAYGPSSFLTMDEETRAEKATLQPVATAVAQAPPMRGGVVADSGTRGAAGPPPAVPPPGSGRAGGPASTPHDDGTSAESRYMGAPIQTVPDRVRMASPLTYVSASAPPFLLMHGLADDSVPHAQSVQLYDALVRVNAEVTLRLVDGLPHTFFNRTNLDELAAPFRMDVREHPKGGAERKTEDRAGVFDVARAFFTKHLKR